MPVKRSRTGPSSRSVTGAAVSIKAERSPPNYATVASPARAVESGEVKIGEFLEQCHYCRKRIAQDSEVFMYGGLCAFCSPECRDAQITLDQLARKKP